MVWFSKPAVPLRSHHPLIPVVCLPTDYGFPSILSQEKCPGVLKKFSGTRKCPALDFKDFSFASLQ